MDPRVSVVRTMSAVWLCGLVVAAAGCAATTAFKTTWRNPETKPISFEGQKVIALVYSRDESTRRTAEDMLAARITALGAQGLAGWTIFPTADAQNDEKARAAIAAAGATAAVTMEIVAQNRESQRGERAGRGELVESRIILAASPKCLGSRYESPASSTLERVGRDLRVHARTGRDHLDWSQPDREREQRRCPVRRGRGPGRSGDAEGRAAQRRGSGQ